MNANEVRFLEGVQNAQIRDLFAKVKLLENMVDDLANQIVEMRRLK